MSANVIKRREVIKCNLRRTTQEKNALPTSDHITLHNVANDREPIILLNARNRINLPLALRTASTRRCDEIKCG